MKKIGSPILREEIFIEGCLLCLPIGAIKELLSKCKPPLWMSIIKNWEGEKKYCWPDVIKFTH